MSNSGPMFFLFKCFFFPFYLYRSILVQFYMFLCVYNVYRRYKSSLCVLWLTCYSNTFLIDLLCVV